MGNNIGYYSYNQTTGESLNSASFSYNNKDEMIQSNINGQSYNISYSSTGQPNVYLGWEIDYDMRNICVIENDDYYVEYYYNANGIRVGKSIYNGSTVELVNYILNGNNIIKETHSGENNYTIEYYYDSSDNIIGFTYNGNKYLYLKNLQNDVIGIVDSNNNLVVKYYYDAYGRIIKTNDTSGINLSTINPFRYRSYYHDNETGWYYLNSRYYNPLANRFVTMDQIEYLGASGNVLSFNLYSYCENNPVTYSDNLGTSIISNLFSRIINIKNGVLSIARGVFSGIIDGSISIIGCIIQPLGAASTMLTGVKNIGKALSKRAFEKIAKKVFTKKIITWIVKAVVALFQFLLSLTINVPIGMICNSVYGCAWMLSSIGNFIGGIMDFLDGRYDGYFKIKIN